MKIMAIDYGDARTGLAICDKTEFLARPLPQINEKNMVKIADQIVTAAQQNQAEMLVLGLPRNMDGTEGARAQKSRKLAALLEQKCDLPIQLWDERSTTITAAGILSENGTFGKKRKDILDSVSATVILENFLSFRKNNPQK